MKKIISLVLTMTLMIGINQTVFGLERVDLNSVPYTSENVEKYEKRENVKVKPLEVSEDLLVVPLWEDPGAGATMVKTTSRWTTGMTYDDAVKSGTLSNIGNISCVILNNVGSQLFITKIINIVNDIATVCGVASSAVDTNKGASVRLFHSYSYYSKLGQVWTGIKWETKVELETKEWYGHEHASFAGKDGVTYTDHKDLGKIYQEYKSHWSDDTWIQNKAYEAWVLGKPTYADTFTSGVYKY